MVLQVLTDQDTNMHLHPQVQLKLSISMT